MKLMPLRIRTERTLRVALYDGVSLVFAWLLLSCQLIYVVSHII